MVIDPASGSGAFLIGAIDRLNQIELAERLKYLLRRHGRSAREVSLSAGLSESAIKNVLQGKARSPRMETLEKIARTLGVPVAVVLPAGITMKNAGHADTEWERAIERDIDEKLRRLGSDFEKPLAPLPDWRDMPLSERERLRNRSLVTADPARMGRTKEEQLSLASLTGNATVPLMGVAECGPDGFFEINMTGEPIDWLPRPRGIENARDAFSIRVQGDSMFPWRASGDPVFVVPSRPVLVGGHVLVTIEAGKGNHPKALVKRLVKRDDRQVVLHQYNLPEERGIERKDVLDMWPIMEWSELFGF